MCHHHQNHSCCPTEKKKPTENITEKVKIQQSYNNTKKIELKCYSKEMLFSCLELFRSGWGKMRLGLKFSSSKMGSKACGFNEDTEFSSVWNSTFPKQNQFIIWGFSCKQNSCSMKMSGPAQE